MFIGYQMFAFLRDYNDFFLHARQVNQLDDQVDNNGPINSSTSKDVWIKIKKIKKFWSIMIFKNINLWS